MVLIGLTGGIGMGKSAATKLLESKGCSVIDTDVLAREIVEPGQPALAEIETVFGPQVISAAGRLRRDELARLVFADPTRLRQLEGILHPRIRERWLVQAQAWRDEGRPICVVVIPLLFETKAEREFDKILCVACSEASQRSRLRARGWPEEQIQQRIQAQWAIEKKILASHYVVWTEASLEVHAEQLDRILAHLRVLPR